MGSYEHLPWIISLLSGGFSGSSDLVATMSNPGPRALRLA